jgi:putative membrane-bound dehydrogenase-like protein
MILRLLPFIISATAAARPPSADDFVLRSDCQIELWAAEPAIVDPVGLAFDAAGRAFVLEMRDYPYGMDGKGQAGGTVRLLEDTTNDGKPDKATVFAEGLRFATSICAVKDGVVVSAPPEIVFLADRDGDGKAEVREVWFTGFAAGVTDSNFNGLRWHMDGRIHGVNGGNGGLIVHPKQPDKVTRLAELDFAFDPQTMEFTTTYPTGGGFGLVFDDAGRSFVTHNINHMQMRILPQSVLDEVPGGSPLRGTQNISVHGENCRIYPIHDAQTRPNHPEQAGWFSSAGGMGYLNHTGWPASMANSLFVCDAASGIVHREVLSPDGPILKCQRPPDEQTSEFLAGKDPAFRPVGVELGPDGALYIIDMQRDVIEHPDYIPPRMKSKVDLRAGSDRGRIWRITPKAGLPKPEELPAKASVEERVALLGSPNQWTRLTAQRLLIEQPDEKAVPLLRAAFSHGKNGSDTKDAPPASYSSQQSLHALWTLTLLDKLTPAELNAAIAHPAPHVRAAALQAGAVTADTTAREARAALASDPDATVRWQFLLNARDPRVDDKTRLTVARDALQRDGGNSWQRAAAMRLLNGHADEVLWLLLVHSHELSKPDAFRDLARAQTEAEPLAELLRLAADLGTSQLTAAAEGALIAVKAGNLTPMLPSQWIYSDDPGIMDAALVLHQAGAEFDHQPNREALHNLVLRFIASCQTTTSKAPWLRLLRHFPLQKTAPVLLPALHAGEASEIQDAALHALRTSKDPDLAARIVKDWPLIAPALRPALAALMVDRREFRPALADALVSGAIKAGEINLDLEQRRTLLRHSGEEIKNKVSKFLTDDEYSNRAALVDEWLTKLPVAGDAARGKVAYQKLCFQCHRADGIGHEVGPDLAAQSHRSVEDLLTHILDPDAAINPNYAAFLAETDDGQKHTGILVSSSGANIVLRQAMGLKVELPRAKVKKLESTGHSLMPAGMEAAYTPQEMRDLIAFLQQRE